MSETDLSRSIQAALETMGVWVERIQAGQHRVRGGHLQCASPGTPDLLCVDLGLWLEVKTPTGKPRPSQELWHARAKSKGVPVVIVRSVSEAMDAVSVWRMERRR